MTAQPVRDHIWLKKLANEKLANKIGSIWLPDQAIDDQKFQIGEIVAIGPDVLEQPPVGTVVPGLPVVVKHLRGDPLTLRKEDYAAYGLKDGELVLIVQEEDLEAIFTEEVI